MWPSPPPPKKSYKEGGKYDPQFVFQLFKRTCDVKCMWPNGYNYPVIFPDVTLKGLKVDVKLLNEASNEQHFNWPSVCSVTQPR